METKIWFVFKFLFGTKFLFAFNCQAVKSETSGNFGFGLLTILRCAESPAKYFAKVYI